MLTFHQFVMQQVIEMDVRPALVALTEKCERPLKIYDSRMERAPQEIGDAIFLHWSCAMFLGIGHFMEYESCESDMSSYENKLFDEYYEQFRTPSEQGLRDQTPDFLRTWYGYPNVDLKRRCDDFIGRMLRVRDSNYLPPENVSELWDEELALEKQKADEIYYKKSRQHHEERLAPLFMEPVDRGSLKNPYMFDQVQNHASATEEVMGLIAFGKIRQGKTRAVVELIKRDRFPYYQFVRMVEFSAQAKKPHGANNYIRELLEEDTIILDDLHQAKMSPAFAEHLFSLIDGMQINEVTPYFTSQLDGQALKEKWTRECPEAEATIEAIMARIREMCVPYDFNYYPEETQEATDETK